MKKNPILKGFYPDPSICRVGEDYYLICSSFEFFPGVPIFHSRDLENWRQIGNVLDRPSQLPLQGCRASHGIWAPTIRHHNGKFYVVTTIFAGKTDNFIVSAANPAGPWSEPIHLNLPVNGIDPSLFFDDDGKCYLTVSQNYQCEINPDTGELLTEMHQVWQGVGQGFMEAPHLYKIGEYYYLIDAEGGTGRCHMTAAGRGKSPWGPFENCPHPVVTARGVDSSPVQCCGHSDFVEDGKGNWYAVFLAIREVPGFFPRVHHLGRETFLAPLSWENGWPRINGGRPITEGEFEETVLTDDFSIRRPGWLGLRNPSEGNATFERNRLTLTGNGQTLNTPQGNPSTLLLRPPDKQFELTARFIGAEGIGGITLFMNEDHHYDFFRTGGGWTLRRKIGDLTDSREYASESITAGLRFTAGGIVFFTGEAAERVNHATVSNRYLSVESAGGFTGLLTGFFADGNARIQVANITLKTIAPDPK